MGPESGLQERSEGIEGVPIGRLLSPKERGRDAFSYFPNSFSRHSGEYGSERSRVRSSLWAGQDSGAPRTGTQKILQAMVGKEIT